MAIITGTSGNDDLIGTAGNDTINPLDNLDGYDIVRASTGNDSLIFTSAVTGFFDLLYYDLNAGIAVNIDTNSANGTVNKGANGFDTLVDVDRAIRDDPGGVYFEGTDFNDTFNISLNEDNYFHYQAGAGTDTHNLTLNGGTVRMDFRGGNQGININLASQTISNDGYGNSEGLSFTNTGGKIQIQATDFSDTIVGSASNEDFFLRSGNDKLTAGGGVDTLRFDRNDMESVTVDLAAGTATGIFDGNLFSHTFTGIENVRGARDANDNDRIFGDSGENRLDGKGGNDVLRGRGGDDDLEGGDGNDLLVGGNGENYLDGGDGNDTLDASWTDANGWGDYIKPGTGINTIIGSMALWNNDDGIDLAYDDVNGSGGINITVGANGTGTTVSNNAGIVNDTFTYAHFFIGTHDNDTFVGGNEDRFEGFRGNAGDDTFNGRGGYDKLDYYWEARDNSTASGVSVDFSLGTATDTYGDTDTFSNFEAATGTEFSDTFIGKNGADFLSFEGLEGNDVMTGSLTGYEQVYYLDEDNRGGKSGINANLTTGKIIDGFGDTDTVSNIDEIRGTDHNDIMFGSSANEKFQGEGGNDTLKGGGGDDTLLGGWGSDTLQGGTGEDSLYGGSWGDLLGGEGGNDLLDGEDGNDRMYGGWGSDTLQGGNGDDRLYGGTWGDFLSGDGGNDTLYGQGGNDELYGSWGSDKMLGGTGNDRLYGGTWGDLLGGDAGNDFLNGQGGNDKLYGGSGADKIYGGNGNDTLFAGTGQDLLAGNSGYDTFVFRSAAEVGIGGSQDIITDFTSGKDHIDLSAMGLTYIGNSAFSGGGAELRFVSNATNGYLVGDTNGDGLNDFILLLESATSLQAVDLII